MKRFPSPFVMILSGVPMSGKSTWLKENYPNTMVISRDDILLDVAGTDDYGKAFYNTDSKLVDRKLREKLILAASLGQDVILDMVNGSAKTRKRNLAYFSDDFYRVAVVFPVLSQDEYTRRNEFRKVNENKFIPPALLSNMINSFTIASDEEGFDEFSFLISLKGVYLYSNQITHMNTINLNNVKLIDGQFTNSESWGELIFENDGSFTQEEQSMIFECDNKEVIVNFTYSVDAHITEDIGDYYTPSSSEAVIDGVDIDIQNIFIDEVETNLDSDSFAFFVKQVRKELD